MDSRWRQSTGAALHQVVVDKPMERGRLLLSLTIATFATLKPRRALAFYSAKLTERAAKERLPRQLFGHFLVILSVSKQHASASNKLEFLRVWSQGGSNPRPLACHASALPTELWPRAMVPTYAAGRELHSR